MLYLLYQVGESMKTFLLILLILFIASFIYGWVTYKPDEKKMPAKAAGIDAAIAVLDELKDCINRISTTDSIVEYRNQWSKLYGKLSEAKRYNELAKKAGISLDSIIDSVSKMEMDYQWMLRDVIERMQKKVSKAMKTTFRNSREHKARIYSEFCQENKFNCYLFEEETT